MSRQIKIVTNDGKQHTVNNYEKIVDANSKGIYDKQEKYKGKIVVTSGCKSCVKANDQFSVKMENHKKTHPSQANRTRRVDMNNMKLHNERLNQYDI